MPAGSMGNPLPAMPQFPSAARLARLRSRLLRLVGWSYPSDFAVPGCLHLLQAFARGWEPLRGILCSEPATDKHGRRVTAKGIGSAQLHYPGQPLCPLARHSCLECPQMGVAAGLPWTLTTRRCTEPASGCSQNAPKFSAAALNQNCQLLTPHRRAAMCLGLVCYSQNTLGATAPETPAEWLLPGSQSLRVLLTLAQRCPCNASLGHVGIRRVLGSSVLAPSPSPLLRRRNPRCLDDANTLAVPAAQQCLHHSPHRLRTALCHSQSQTSTCQQRGGSSTGENSRHCVFPFWPKLPHGRAGCWAWVLPRFRRAQGFGAVVCPRGRCPWWVAGVTRQQGRGAEVSSRVPGTAGGVWGAAGAAQDVPEPLVGGGCRRVYGQKVRSISRAEHQLCWAV